MPRLDDLPPDLRATLSLLVDRGKSYAQVAELLGIPEQAVRDRAHAALDALAGAPGETPPAHGGPSDTPPAGSRTDGGTASRRGAAGISAAAAGLPVSRRGGALLLGGIVIVVIVAVVLLTSGGGGGSGTSTGTSASATTSTGAHTTSTSTSGTKSSSTTGSKANVTNQITLTPPEPSSKSIGIAEILAEGSQHAIYVAAEHIPPTHGFFYVLWLYNSPSSAQAIGKTTVNSTARMQAGALLPANAGDYHQLLLTRETAERPSQPGPTVLSGAFSLNK
jgi:preprotein translocase subunit SecG